MLGIRLTNILELQVYRSWFSNNHDNFLKKLSRFLINNKISGCQNWIEILTIIKDRKTTLFQRKA